MTPSQQLIVDNLTGFFAGDAVQIDAELLTRWRKRFKGRGITEVEVEAFGGKVTRCKVKAIGDSDYKGKGLVRIPERIARELKAGQGELVRIKPVKP